MEKVGAVLVVGAGIGGSQTSLDLGDAGFKVYLVESTTSIGGVMAQLDKTFPTNDCAMCIVSPKLVETGRHQNIDLSINCKILDVTGEAGNFAVKVLKQFLGHFVLTFHKCIHYRIFSVHPLNFVLSPHQYQLYQKFHQ